MEIIVRGRRLGKTEELIKESAKTGYYIVAINHRLAEITSRAKELGLKIPFPITFSEFLDGRFRGLDIKGFLIDDVDVLLLQLSRGVPIAAVTITRGDKSE